MSTELVWSKAMVARLMELVAHHLLEQSSDSNKILPGGWSKIIERMAIEFPSECRDARNRTKSFPDKYSKVKNKAKRRGEAASMGGDIEEALSDQLEEESLAIRTNLNPFVKALPQVLHANYRSVYEEVTGEEYEHALTSRSHPTLQAQPQSSTQNHEQQGPRTLHMPPTFSYPNQNNNKTASPRHPAFIEPVDGMPTKHYPYWKTPNSPVRYPSRLVDHIPEPEPEPGII